MTATDELRRMLDERGVEHYDGYDYTEWDVGGIHYLANDHLRLEGRMVLRRTCTPEQAIEATLGPRVQPPAMPEQPPYDLLIDLLRDEWDIDVMWDGLRRFWYVGLTDEGVRKRDEQEATLGRGTCKPVDGYDDDGEEIGTCCSECGSPWPVYYVVRYCPVCGCKVVDDASVD